MFRALVLLLALVTRVYAVGEPFSVRQGAVSVAPEVTFMDFVANDFFLQARPGGGVRLSLGPSVTRVGSCVGDVPGDFCGTVDLSGSLITHINVQTMYGGTSAGSALTLDATSAATALGNTAELIKAVNPVLVFPAGITSTLTSPFGVSVGTSGQTNAIGGTTPAVQAFQALGTYRFDVLPHSSTSWVGQFLAPSWSGNAGAGSYGGPRGVVWQPSISFTTASWSHTLVGQHASLVSPTLAAMSGSATATLSRHTGIIHTAAVVGAGWTVTDYNLLKYTPPTLSGAITNEVVVDIDDLSAGGTLRAGMRCAVSAGTGRYCIQATGSAQNDLGGTLNVNTVAPTITAQHNVLSLLPNGLIVDGATNFRGVFFGSTITYEANPSAFGAGAMFNAAPTLVNPNGEARTMSAFTILGNSTVVTPNADDNMTALSIYTAFHNIALTGSTGAHTATSITGLRFANATDANWTVSDMAAVHVLNPTDGAVSGTATISRLVGLKVEPLSAGAANASVHSDGTQVFAHEGGGCFGCTQSATTVTGPVATAVLELASTTQGFLPPRMTRAQMVAISSPPDGLAVYCSDCTTDCSAASSSGSFCGRRNAAWVGL